ncbi:phosphodiester glycosidase family protein [Candidatus Sumerlaeota bacterium]|nr:phosphodiester glycosidase family protein [Candidatus Sumerlaeota bacterium]
MMRFQTRHLVPLAFALSLLGSAATALPDFPDAYGFVDGADFHVERTIAPGITHRFDSYSTGPLTINTVLVDMSRGDLAIEVEKGKDDLFGAETLPAMTKRLADPGARPLVAINADFWGSGHVPIGPLVDEGMIWKAPWFSGKNEGRRRSAFGFDELGNYFIGLPDWSLAIRSASGESLEIPCVNLELNAPDVTTIFTYPGRGALDKAPKDFKQVVLHAESREWLPNAPLKVTVRNVNGTMSTVPDSSTFLLYVKEIPSWMKEGADLILDASLKGLPGKVTGLVGGQPRLVENGRIIVDDALVHEPIGKQFLTDLHPRSAVGMLKDGKTLVFCVVDGRQPRKSIGINLYDLAQYMKSVGCDVAMNLDGGGSSSIAVDGAVTNFPSDAGGPRPVSDAIVIRRTAPLGRAANVKIIPEAMTIPTGARVKLQAIITDASGEALATGGGLTVSETKASGGAVEVEGDSINARRSGSAKVVREYSAPGEKSISGVTNIKVVDPESLAFSPPALLINAGDVETVTLNATAPEGRTFFQDMEVATVQVPSFLEYDQKARTLKALTNGKGVLRARLGNVTAELPVAVGEFSAQEAYSFDTLPSGDIGQWIQFTNASKDGSTITLETENKKSGTAAWRFQYAMEKGGTSKLALPLNVDIPVDTPELGLWVYGDGNEHWLRGELQDSRGENYLVDFTSTKTGINWKDTWKFCTVSLYNPAVRGGTKSAAVPPFKLQTIYIVQPQEAAKKDGAILLDGLGALNLPKDLQAQVAPAKH